MFTHYIIVRRDLPFGVTCAMVAHAAGESFYAFAKNDERGVMGGGVTSARPGSGDTSGAGGGENPPHSASLSHDPEVADSCDICRGSSEKEHPVEAPQGLHTGRSQVQVPPPAPLDDRRFEHIVARSKIDGIPRPTAVVLGARNEQRLQRLERLLRTRGVSFVAIREPDPPFHGQLMAIGLHPGDRDALARHVNEFQLIPEPV